jgi:hypothetical protein
MRRFAYTTRAAAAAALLALLAGCAGRAAVDGTVTFNGEPVDNGGIQFVSEDGKNKGGGEIKGGKYSLTGDHGLPPGKYKVEVYWNKKTGKTVVDKADTGEKMDETSQVIPPEFNTNTTLSAEIKSGTNSGVNFDLKGSAVVPGKGPGGKAAAVGDP